MNTFMTERLVQEHLRDIAREIIDIRLQEQAMTSRVFRPNLFTHAMRRLGQWLIIRGQRLVNRYEVPANCTKSTEHRFAQ